MQIWNSEDLINGMILATGSTPIVYWCDVSEDGQIVSRQPWPKAFPVGSDLQSSLVGLVAVEPVKGALKLAASTDSQVSSVLHLDVKCLCSPIQMNVLPLKPGLARLVLFLDSVPLAAHADPAPKLTPREAAILNLHAAGFRRDAIAWELNISMPTVDMHTRNLRRKLDATTTSEAVASAARHGLISESGSAPRAIG